MIPIYEMSVANKTILRRDLTGKPEYPQALLESVRRIFGQGVTPEDAVSRILKSVRDEGDHALRHWSSVLDRVELEVFQIPAANLEEAYWAIDRELRAALELAAGRIEAFHQRQPLPEWQTKDLGGLLGQRIRPIEKVGFYVPGGTAPLPSSLLMSVIPAQIAGSQKLVVCTPPNPDKSILAAAYLCGLDQVYQVGGAQAIAALAYGTESIPRVDKIVGAGNLFVTLAKQQVYGLVGLDGLAGPTETMVIADATANPEWVAADLLAQAEHDILASAILLTTDTELAEAVREAVSRQLAGLSRREIIEQSLTNRGGIVLVPDLAQCAELANTYAAEHLCLAVLEPDLLIERINNAGGIFIGERSFEVLGDYVAGPSHVMPTGATARFASPLNVLDFVKITSIIGLDRDTSARISGPAAAIARAESLTGHAAAAVLRKGLPDG